MIDMLYVLTIPNLQKYWTVRTVSWDDKNILHLRTDLSIAEESLKTLEHDYGNYRE